VRFEEDIRNIVGPKKYRQLGDFHKYFSGEKSAPIPTFFVGGNHENYDYLDFHYPEGFEVALNIFYLGRSGVKDISGLRIGYFSGIESSRYFDTPRKFSSENGKVHSNKSRRKAMYYNEDELSKLYGEKMDILVAHEFPKMNLLDGEPNHVDDLVRKVKPVHFFAGHLHWHRQRDIEVNGHTINARILAQIGDGGDYEVLEMDAQDFCVNCL